MGTLLGHLRKYVKECVLAPLFKLLEAVLEPSKNVGRAPRQTEDFLNEVVAPVLERYRDVAEEAVEINV